METTILSRNVTHEDKREVASLATVFNDCENRKIIIRWDSGSENSYPYIWLRHNQYFPALGRKDQNDDGIYTSIETPEDLLVDSVELIGHELLINWNGENNPIHHDLAQLRLMSPFQGQKRSPPKYWLRQDAERFHWFDAEDLEFAESRLQIFLQIRDYGIALIRNLPVEAGVCNAVARFLGPVRRTHFGSLFDIRSLPEDQQGTGAQIGATACNAQAPHSDEGWRHNPIGINIFHCIQSHPSGGASIFVDSIGAAERLRVDYKESFEFLSNIPLLFAAERNPQERFRTRALCIARDIDDVVRGVRITDRTLPPIDLPPEKIETAYQALKHFLNILYSSEREYCHHFQPGEMAIFDNHRILHGRRSFDPKTGARWIQQLSIDREEFHNVFRQLGDHLGRVDVSMWEPDAGSLSQNGL